MVAEECRVDGYTIMERLGYGASSKVKLARVQSTDELVALKIRQQEALDPFYAELDFFETVPKHPNILEMLDYKENSLLVKSGQTKRVNYFALEFAPNGELYDYMAAYGAFPEPIARHYFKQILEALT
jgi:serine/threonine protein kinase